ncbi:hypothetical protein KPH14_009928 [Odynerus spinipes]|uniref:Deleted in lung and esophageal cancer protein 1 n=1 Tax=Odynerus spinipes TaxID=1348599 RepID=A0AAD9RSS2_9HYME|nr:hypothetical protein KPH14_009928 [Odynerus spinipes]
MQLKLIVLFYTEDVCEEEEIITIYVQYGKSIDIKLQCTRDPPILKRINKPYVQCSVSEIHNLSVTQSITFSSDSWESYTTEFLSTTTESDNYSDKSLIHIENSNMMFECGRCFVGEQVALQMKFRNSGGGGRFFIISEIDWYSMYIEVDTLYIISDNYSLNPVELIGDGIMYEPQIFEIKGSQETCLFLTNIDAQFVAHYCLNLQTNPSEEILTSQILVTNRSQTYMFFHWEKSCTQVDGTKEIIDNDNFLDYLHIQPESGIFPASVVLEFNIMVTIPQIYLQDNQVYGFLRLYVEDIPEAAISKKYELWSTESKTKRRVCSSSVDVLVADIKLMQHLHFDTTLENKSWILDKYINVVDEEDIFEITESLLIEEEGLNYWYIDEKCVPMPSLMLEELYSTLDIIDIKSIESCFPESVISSGILRPLRLFIGIKEILTVGIKNTLCTPVTYKWGDPVGLDSSKLKLICCPESGYIPAGIVENIQIICCPIEVGHIKSLHIPCYIGSLPKIILLQIESEIKSLYVTLHIPCSNDNTSKVSKSSICIEWNSSSISVRPDLLKIQKSMLDKTVFKKSDMQGSCMTNKEIVSQDTSVESFETDEGVFNGENIISDNIEIEHLDFQNSEDLTRKINWEDDDHFTAFKQLVPFHKIQSVRQPVVIEFIEVPLGIVTKKTFLIRNETPIASCFWLRISNFYPVYVTQKRKIKEDMIKSIYKEIIGHQTEDIWKEIKQPLSGILIYVNPLITQLGPYEDALIDIYVFVDTWGIYVDELEIHIPGLPPYILAIGVQVTESPISFPICEKTQLKIPICRFGTLSANSPKESRIVLIKNRSSVPLMINWQIVSTEIVPKSNSPPFNVILHMRTPFTNKLAIGLRKIQEKNETKKLLRNRVEIYTFQNCCQQLNDHTFETFPYEYTDTCTLPKTDSHSHINESKTIEFQIDLVPYNLMNKKICAIYPEDTFISAKGKAYVGIKVFPDKCRLDNDRYKILCNALGFIQIAPMDKYKDKHYCRHRNLLTPVKIQIEAEIVKSRLVYDIPKSDRLFIFCTDDIMTSPRDIMKIKKTFIFHNKGENPIYVKFEINGPFMIDYISSQTNSVMDNFTEETYIEGWNSVQVHVTCLVDAKLIEEIMETNNNIKLQNKSECSKQTNNWCNKGLLLVTYADHSFETLELFVKINLPLLQLSSYSLNFGNVCVGDTKKFLLDVENLSACKCKVKVNKTMSNEAFTYDPAMGEILARPVSGKHILTITVCFSPRNIGSSKEILKIMSTVPNYMEQCVLCGKGILDEKVHEMQE